MSVIVVGVDDSPTARRAADVAAGLASALQARLLVVSAFPIASMNAPNVVSDAVVTQRDVAERLAHTIAGDLRAAHPGLDIADDAEPGRPGEALVKQAAEHDASLIVIGNRRAQGVSRILGSVAVDVVRKAPCDVYIAHTQD